MAPKSTSKFSRWLDGFLKKRPSLERRISGLGLFLEDLLKVPVFRCQRCGECILSHTAFICSQRCPKRLRNGACGGTRPDGYCEVYPERRCIWNAIYRRSRLLGRVSLLTEIMPAHQWRVEHGSAWLNVFCGRIEPPVLLVRRVIDKLDLRAADRARQEREP
jgi:methylenetetrahydrofolate reductase (NADPH)